MRAAPPIAKRRAASVSPLTAALLGATISCASAQSVPVSGVSAMAACPSVLAGERANRIANRVADRFEQQRSQWNSDSALTYLRAQLATGLRAELASAGGTANDPAIRDLSGAAVSACFPRLGTVMAGLTQGSDYERFTASQRQRREEEAARRQAEAEASRQRAEAEQERQAELRRQREMEAEHQEAEQRAAAESARVQREAVAKAQEEADRAEREQRAAFQRQRETEGAAERDRLASERTARVETVQPSAPAQIAQADNAAAAQTDAATTADDIAPLTPGKPCPDWLQRSGVRNTTSIVTRAFDGGDFGVQVTESAELWPAARRQLLNAFTTWCAYGEPCRAYVTAVSGADRQTVARCLPNVGASLDRYDAYLAGEAKQQAEAASPRGRLLTAYRSFVGVLRCQKSRLGRAFVYVTEPEVAESKDQVKEAEAALTATDPSLDKEALWAEANKVDPAVSPQDAKDDAGIAKFALYALANGGRLDVEAGEFSDAGKNYCVTSLHDLRAVYEGLTPQAHILKKEF